jgi:hypothetical protein
MRRPTIALCLFLAVSACAEPEAEVGVATPKSFTSRDSAGVSIAETAEGSALAGIAVDPQPELVIGRPGDPDYEFLQARWVQRLGTGATVVANTGAHELLFYDRAGTFVRRVGREGDGAGEFRALGPMRRMDADTLAISDGRARRITIVDSTGAVVRMVPWVARGEERPEGNLACAPSGTLGMLRGDVPVFTGMICFELGSSGLKMQRTTYHVGGAGVDRVLGTFDLLPIYVGGGQDATVVVPPLAAAAQQQVTPDAFVFSPGTHREIRVYGADGSLERVIRDLDPTAPVGEADREAVRAGLAGAGRPLAPDVPFPERLPAWDRLEVDDRGNYWGREFLRPGQGQERWRVYDREGRRLGGATLPAGFELSSVREGRLIGLNSDGLGVQRVEVYRLSGG